MARHWERSSAWLVRVVDRRWSPPPSADPRAIVDGSDALARRRRTPQRGEYDTPWPDAERLARAMPVDVVPAMWGDPCVGVGRLLVAAWEHVGRNVPPSNLADWRRALRAVDPEEDAVQTARSAVRAAIIDRIWHLYAEGEIAAATSLAAAELDTDSFVVGDAIDELPRWTRRAFVLTNPPFIPIRALTRLWGAERLEAVRAEVREAVGAFDSGIPIVARSLERCRPDGWFGAVIPATWLSTDYASELRSSMALMGAWTDHTAEDTAFDAAVHVRIVSWPATDGLPSLPLHATVDYPDGTVPLSTLAEVRGGTPGFDASAVADALVEAPAADAWPFVTTRHVRDGQVVPGQTRFMKRSWKRPMLPHAAVTGDARSGLYSRKGKLLVPGMMKRFRVAKDPLGCALGVGVFAILSEDPDDLLARLDSELITRWIRDHHPGLAMSGGYFRMTASVLREIPVRQKSTSECTTTQTRDDR